MLKRVVLLVTTPLWCCLALGFLAILLVGCLYFGISTTPGLALTIVGAVLIGLSLFIFILSLFSIVYYPRTPKVVQEI